MLSDRNPTHPRGEANETLAEALADVARGWAVLPTRPDKTPASRLIRATRGTRGWAQLARRPAGEEEVCGWFELEPGTGVGVICGESSGNLVVVDVDDQARAPELPETASVTTARGRHHYFAGGESTASRTFEWGEVRANGSYVVAPASRASSGHRYRWELSPDDVELERFEAAIAGSGQVGTYLASKPQSSPCPTAIGSTCLKACGSRARVVDSAAAFESLERSETAALRLAATLGAPESLRLGETFPCLIHPDGSPSASLWRRDSDAHVLYRDWHARRYGDREWLSLALVRARLAGRDGQLAVPELTVWKLRLAREAGLLEPLELDADRPTLPSELELVWDGFLRLLALRWTIEAGTPAPFSARFAAAWCGVSRYEAHARVRELAGRGLLRPAGRDPAGTRLWLPEGVRPLA